MPRWRTISDEPTLLSPRDLTAGGRGEPGETGRINPIEATVLGRRRPLVLPKYLAEEARSQIHAGKDADAAYAILCRWADLEAQGALARSETSLDAQFLGQVFGDALHYRDATRNPDEFELERNFAVPGIGRADAVLGRFRKDVPQVPAVVIELKSADTHLDTDRSNGRTAVQQCWDYLNNLPGCTWGIVSNFVSFRLYHRDCTQQRFEHFTLQELRDRARFQQFWVLFERDGLLPSSRGQPPRAERLLTQTKQQQREVGDALYQKYDESRLALVEHLHRRQGRSLDQSIRIAQKLLDRIVFVAFCEDRGLIKDKSIERAGRDLPPYSKVTNPRWRNFLGLFRGLDVGHADLDLETGFDGGLFAADPEVDDLDLADEWTEFFLEVGGYDFSNEVNVDVLGHLFERSITDLERLRTYGLPAVAAGERPSDGTMPKSAQRKRYGIYYTPPELTDLIVRETLGPIVNERLAEVAERHGVAPDTDIAAMPRDRGSAYARDCIAALRSIRVLDPACGSGAFLIQAYELLLAAYQPFAEAVVLIERHATPRLIDELPDYILNDNLFGVDLSIEAVEITQLALWLRSARRGRTLADLSKNVVRGNSLASGPSVDPNAVEWSRSFPTVCGDDVRPERRGFDCIIGNPPWERLKLQEREFFSAAAPEIASAVSAATRRKLISELARSRPELRARYEQAKAHAERMLRDVRESGLFPLTGKGDVNTYPLFAELAARLVSPRGRVGMLLPSGIATDESTKEFFGELVRRHAMVALYDFENRHSFFPDVHKSFKFCAFVFNGTNRKTKAADFVFFAHAVEDLRDRKRHIALSADDLSLLNPNTRTCPIFRNRRDAELTKAIYQRVPVLVQESRRERGNPWGVRFVRMFDQTNDAELFRTGEELSKAGFKLVGNRWIRRRETYLPLYEAKMVQAYDHRAAGVVIEKKNWVRQGQTKPTSLVQHQQPDFVVQPRWWVAQESVHERLGPSASGAVLVFKDVTSPTNQRTMIASFAPTVGFMNSAPIIRLSPAIKVAQECCLLANLNSFVLDFVARSKVGGVHLNFFIVEQFPVLPPDDYERPCPWAAGRTLESWIAERVLKLTCTADDMRPLAEAAGFGAGVHKWRPDERAQLMAELDAAYFILYGLSREETEYVLSTFPVARQPTDAPGDGRPPADRILTAYDALTEAARGRPPAGSRGKAPRPPSAGRRKPKR